MTDPVDTNALRAWAVDAREIAASGGSGSNLVVLCADNLFTAADEVDRLRDERDDWVRMFCDAEEGRRRNWIALDVLRAEIIGKDADLPAWKRVAYQRKEIRAVNADRDRLRAVIENAPHDTATCLSWFGPQDAPCTCWKADAQ